MAPERLRGTLHLPADKSIAQRALLFTALARGAATVEMHLPGADVLSALEAMRSLGAVSSVVESSGRLTVSLCGGADGAARLPGSGHVSIDCGNSGTLMRLLSGAALTRGDVTLTGDNSLSARPMERVAAPLRRLGGEISTSAGHAPLQIGRSCLRAAEVALPVASAQVLGATILAACGAAGTSRITVPGPTRDHTERLLRFLGAAVEREGLTTVVRGPAVWQARHIAVPADPSAAAFWLVAGAVHPDAEIVLPAVGLNPTRTAITRVLERMGAAITVAPGGEAGPEPTGNLTVRSAGRLRAVELAGGEIADLIDELPILAVAMAAAEGTSTVRDAGELRVKESDRLRLVADMLRALGVAVTELQDGWQITGRPLTSSSRLPAATITTAGDHRIAMSAAIANLVGVGERGAQVDDRHCAAVSYPSFWEDLESLA